MSNEEIWYRAFVNEKGAFIEWEKDESYGPPSEWSAGMRHSIRGLIDLRYGTPTGETRKIASYPESDGFHSRDGWHKSPALAARALEMELLKKIYYKERELNELRVKADGAISAFILIS